MNGKRILCTILAMALAVSCLLFGGCSTPSIALQVDDKVYTMGDYLAYMYNTMSADQQISTYLYYYGTEALSEKVPYGEEEKEITLSEYIKRTTQDVMIRQKAIEDLLKTYDIAWNEEDLKKINEDISKMKPDTFLSLGFNNDRYIAMYKAVYLNESSLFFGLYDKGGKKEVSNADERKWFDEHYYSYKSIEIPLVDSETNKELPAEDVTKIENQLKGYLDIFNKDGKNNAAFDMAYRQYLDDTTKDSTDTTSKTDQTETTDKEEEAATAPRNDLVDTEMDEELLKVIKTMKEGEIAIKTYQKSGTNKTMALIFRMDPEADRGKTEDGKDIDFYADSHKQILQYMKYDEMNEEIEKKVKELADKITVNKQAIKAAKPADMLQ